MDFSGYSRIELFRAKCNSTFESLHCIAWLEEDLGALLPFLNARLGGHEYLKNPPALIVKSYGRLITFHADRVAINALSGEEEARKILGWVRREVVETREEVTGGALSPCYEGAPKPDFVAILRALPRMNCGDCGQPTCLVFATRLVEDVADPCDCPPLRSEAHTAGRQALERYLSTLRR